MFSEYLRESGDQINARLKDKSQEILDNVKQISPAITNLMQTFIHHCEGGKRIRGTLVKFGYECIQNNENKDILDVAIAFEYFQTAILGHDDIIDQSPLRRGKPTMYHELGNNHYGISQTICLGDIGFFIANQIIGKSNFEDHLKVKALNCFNAAAMETGYGQMLDILLPHHSQNKIQKEDIITIYKCKTGVYTISGPLRLGAILAGANENILQILDIFGVYLGIAFQIQDDILGIYGEETKLGKSTQSDIQEGKSTLLSRYCHQHTNPAQKKIYDQRYGNTQCTHEGAEEIKVIFQETGALKYAQECLYEYIQEAKNMLKQIPITEKYKNILESLADFLIKREK